MLTEMTLFYSKITGKCQAMCGGVQTFDFFGESKVDFEQIYDILIIPFDHFVVDNFREFVYRDGKLEYVPTDIPITSYTINLK